MPKRRTARKALAYISFGPHVKLYSEDYFINELIHLGMTRRGFRALCAALSVPMIEIGSTRLVDQLSFSLALRAILHIGRPTFLAPGSATKAKSPFHYCTKLDARYVEKNLTILISELLALPHLPNEAPRQKTLTLAAEEAARRMKLAGFAQLSRVQQDRYTRAALRTTREKSLISTP